MFVLSPKKDTQKQAATLEQFKNAFIDRLNPYIGKRLSKNVSKINRRLDALARLLERDQICVAVRYDPVLQKIIISSNKVFKNSHATNKSINNINKLMQLLASHESTMDEITDELSNIISENIYQEFRYECNSNDRTLDGLNKEINSLLVQLFYSGDKTKAWEESRDTPNGSFEEILIKRTSKLARDFMKLRKSILDLSHSDGEEKEILEAMQNKKFILYRHGKKDTHAEIRQVSDILENNRKKNYIGTSKLCCARCALTVDTLEIPARGQHGRIFNTWPTPGFFKSISPSVVRILGDEAAKIYNALGDEDKALALKFIEEGKELIQQKKTPRNKMLPDTSSSDEALGLSDEELNEVDVSDILNGNRIKRYEPDAYKTLRQDENLSIQELVEIHNDSSEKFSRLGSSDVKSFLKNYRERENVTVEKLADLYDKDPDLFDYVIASSTLIEEAGFEETIEYYRQALEQKKVYEKDPENFSNDFDVDDVAESLYHSEEGVDLHENSSDSENSDGSCTEDDTQLIELSDDETDRDSPLSLGYSSD